MTCFAQFRKTLGLALLACALTLPMLLVSQLRSTHSAHASINVAPPLPPVDGTWSALLGPITTVTAPAFITVTNPDTKFAVLDVVDHRLTGDVSWVELMAQP